MVLVTVVLPNHEIRFNIQNVRILIVKLGSIGDIVHTLPSLAVLRHALPHAEISWVVERTRCRNFKRQPAFGSPHRSRHEGAEARADVWGDAAGTAPAVTSVTRLRLRSCTRFSGLLKSASIARLSGARRIFGFSREGLREPQVGFSFPKRSLFPSTHT